MDYQSLIREKFHKLSCPLPRRLLIIGLGERATRPRRFMAGWFWNRSFPEKTIDAGLAMTRITVFVPVTHVSRIGCEHNLRSAGQYL